MSHTKPMTVRQERDYQRLAAVCSRALDRLEHGDPTVMAVDHLLDWCMSWHERKEKALKRKRK